MSEINGRTPNVGDRILVGSQLGQISSYDELANRFSYDIVDGNGINIVAAHINNTPFEILSDFPGHLGSLSADLDDQLADVKFVAAPVDPNEPNVPKVSDGE